MNIQIISTGSNLKKMPKILIFYHYFYPDDVISAQHMTELGEGLVKKDWKVEAMPCNRGCRDETQKFPKKGNWNGIRIRRIWRPRFSQKHSISRILNSIWMTCAWSIMAFRKKHVPDILLIGTEPILSVIIALFWKIFRPQVQIVHWCFDLYPEAAVADGIIKQNSFALKIVKYLMYRGYRVCDLIVDIGSCMHTKLKTYKSTARTITLTPWALSEPENALEVDRSEREAIFGDALLGIMYSGNFGRAHSYESIFELARFLRGERIKFAFSVRGNCANELRSAVSLHDDNIVFLPFAPQNQLQARLSSADIHIVSLNEEWTGSVVPSKFFGALAVGRPVIFAGSTESAIAKWITLYSVGWVLQPETLLIVAKEIKKLAKSKEKIITLWEHCHYIYKNNFSKNYIIDTWNNELNRLLKNTYRKKG